MTDRESSPRRDGTRARSHAEPHNPPGPARRGRRRRLVIAAGIVAALLALVVASGYVWLMRSNDTQLTGVEDCLEVRTSSPVALEEEASAREAVCATIADLTAAWAVQDAEAYGGGFTEDATYTTFAGTYYSGREDIVRSHAALFDEVLADTQLADRFLELRFLTAEVAVLTTRGDNYEGDDPGELTKVQTYTLVRDGQEWKVASFQNTQRKPIMEAVQYLWMPGTRPAAERTDG